MRLCIPADVKQAEGKENQAEAVVKFRVFCERVLKEKHRHQNQQRERHHADLPAFALPNLLPQRRIGFFNNTRSRINRRRRGGFQWHRCAFGVVHRVGLRQLVIQISCGKGFIVHAQHTLNHQLQPPRLGGIKMRIFRHGKQRDFFEMRRALGSKSRQALMVEVGKAEALIALNHLDAVENAAAHIARAFKRITPFARHHDCLLPAFQTALQIIPVRFTEQAFADGRLAHQSGVKVHKSIVARAFFRVLGRGGFVTGFKRFVHLIHRHVQARNRALIEQRLPRLHIGFFHIHQAVRAGLHRCSHRRRAAGRCGRRGRSRCADAVLVRQRAHRALDAVVNHHQRYRGAADDVGRRFIAGCGRFNQIEADIIVDEFIDLGLRNADQHNRLVVLHQLGAHNGAVVGDAHQNINRLARIAARVHHIGGEIHIAQRLAAFERTRHHRLTLGRAISISARKNFRHRRFGQKFRQTLGPRLRHHRHQHGQPHQHGRQPRPAAQREKLLGAQHRHSLTQAF